MEYKDIYYLGSGNVPRAFHVTSMDKFDNATMTKLAKEHFKNILFESITEVENTKLPVEFIK